MFGAPLDLFFFVTILLQHINLLMLFIAGKELSSLSLHLQLQDVRKRDMICRPAQINLVAYRINDIDIGWYINHHRFDSYCRCLRGLRVIELLYRQQGRKIQSQYHPSLLTEPFILTLNLAF